MSEDGELVIPDPYDATVKPYLYRGLFEKKSRYVAEIWVVSNLEWDQATFGAWIDIMPSGGSFCGYGRTPEEAQIDVVKKYCRAIKKFREWHAAYQRRQAELQHFDPMKVCRDLRGED